MKKFKYRRNDTFRLKCVPAFKLLHGMRASFASDAKLGNIILFKSQSQSLKLVLCLEKLRKLGRLHNNSGFWVNYVL